MNQVYVLSKSGKPLMPTKRFGRVKGLLKSGRAKIFQHKPFTVQLTYDSTEYTQPLTMGIDTGAKHIGVSIVRESGEPVFLGELETRTKEVTDNMEKRALHRHTRRRHRREKRKRRAAKAGTIFTEKEYLINGCEKVITCKMIKPGLVKFENKNRTDKWLTPTCTHLLNTHINFIKKLTSILPVTKVIVEYAKFDIHKLVTPCVRGNQYANGRMKGSTNTQEYVLCRDKHTCKACNRKTGKMHVHHVIWKTNGGADLPENLITLCEKCHSKVHSNQRFNLKVVELFEGVKKRFVHTTILNSVMPELYRWLVANFQEVEKAYGYETKDKRRAFNLEKNHWMDAYLIGIGTAEPSTIAIEPFKFKQFRRHNKANIKRQEDRKYYIGKSKVAVNRHRRAGQTFNSLTDLVEMKGRSILNQLTAKSATRPKRSTKPFGMGDVVRFENKTYTVKGFTGNYLGFIGDDKYNKLMRKSEIIVKNQGICCV